MVPRPAIVALGLVMIAFPRIAAGHPAVGVVIDRQGAVFFTDTQHVWRIAPDGRKSVAVPDVHTHELYIDADGNLFGEHLRYVNERWEHRVWKRSPAGTVTDVIAMRSGFRDDHRDFFFARDARGAMYWLERGTPVSLNRRVGAEAIQTVTKLTVKDPGWLSITPRGAALLSSYGVAWRVTVDGAAMQLPASVSRSRDRYAIMGLTEDGAGNVYVAAYADGVVRRVTPSGQVATVATSPRPWAPTGIAVAPDGTLWVLEAAVTNEQRVRRIDPNGRVQVY